MKILLGVTGSVAATLTPKFRNLLEAQGHETQIVVTASSKNFLPPTEEFAHTDEDEWSEYHRDNRVLHIDLVKWADRFIIAPCTANTLAKIQYGLCDNLLTCCVRAWPGKLIIAPAMNTAMFNHPATEAAFQALTRAGHTWVAPQSKTLFCGDTGIGAMADIKDILKHL